MKCAPICLLSLQRSDLLCTRNARLVLRISTLLMLLVLVTSSILGQTFRGSVSGVVTDPAHRPVQDASIQIVDSQTGVMNSTATTSSGTFSVSDLPVGTYKLVVTENGFSTYVIQNIHVEVGSSIRLPIELKVASAETSITISASSLTLDSTSSDLRSVVPEKAVQQIPLNGRDYTQLIKLAPGVNGLGSIGGARLNQNTYLIDGADNNNAYTNTSGTNSANAVGTIAATLLPIDSIDQFSVTQGGSAEYGRTAGGTISVAVKSGTDTLHGSLYYFNRNDALAVTPPFSTVRPKLKNNQFGGSIGGPIVPHRLFYFFSYERQKLIDGNSSPGTEPSGAYVSAAEAELNKYGIPVNPVALNLLTFWPQRGRNGPATPANFVSGDNSVVRSDNGVAKLDLPISARQALSFRYFIGVGYESQTPSPPVAYKEFYQTAPLHNQNGVLTHNFSITQRLVNQLLVGVNFFGGQFRDADTSFDPIAAGLNTGVTNPAFSGSPDMLLSGFDEIGHTPPLNRRNYSGQVVDTLAYQIGKHQLRFGGQYQGIGMNMAYYRNVRGTFSFNGSQGPWKNDSSISDPNIKTLADFLAGNVASSSISVGNPERPIRQNLIEGFIQDSMQVLPQLNISIGGRYSYFGPMSDSSNQTVVFRPNLGGLVKPGQGIDSLYSADHADIAPRVGFAYRPSETSRWDIRAAYGIYFDAPALAGFLDNRPGNNGANGVQANPGGPSPVYTVTRAVYTIVPNQLVFGTAPPPYGITSIAPNLRTSYVESFNASVQYEIAPSVIAQVAYAGSLGRRLLITRDINQAAVSSSGASTTTSQALVTRPYYNQYPQYATINEVESIGSSNYHSLQASIRFASWKGWIAQFAYTFGHSLDNASAVQSKAPTNSNNLAAEYGNSDFDIKHTFTSYIVRPISTVPHVPNWLGAGWQANAFFTFFTGQPFTVFAGTNVSGTFEGRDRVNVVGDPFAGVDQSLKNRKVRWFNPSAFAVPAAGSFGNESRNAYRGPGFGDVDLSLVKDIHFTNRIAGQFRVEAFNVFNRVNLTQPTATLTSGSNGLITDTRADAALAPGIGAGEPYNTQLALKIIF